MGIGKKQNKIEKAGENTIYDNYGFIADSPHDNRHFESMRLQNKTNEKQ